MKNEEKNNLTLEEILNDAKNQDSNNSKKEITKKAIDKTKEISKNATIAVKNKAKESLDDYKYKKSVGIETADEKILSFIRANGIGPMATYNKWKLNRKFKKYENKQLGENSFNLKLTAIKIVIFLVILLIFGIRIFALAPIYIFYKYFQIQFKYIFNSKYYEFDWYLKLLKKNKRLQEKVPSYLFYTIPDELFKKDNQLKESLGISTKSKEMSIVNSKLIFDDRYGWVRESYIEEKYFKKPLNNNALESAEINDFFVIPQTNSNHILNQQVFFKNNETIKQAVEPLLGLCTHEDFIEKIVNDDSINYAFPEIAEKLAKEAEMAALLAQQEAEAKELQELENQIAKKGLSKEVATIIKKIRSKKDIWNFNIWNVADNLTGNSSYFKVRCILRNGKSLKEIKDKKATIEAELRHTVIFNELQDKRSFDLTVILEAQLKQFTMKVSDLKKYNEKDFIFIGKSYTGDLKVKWNYQANHPIFAAQSGAGKTAAMTQFMAQLTKLASFDYRTMFITSSSKVGDFSDFAENGALVAAGIDKQIQVFTYVLNLLKKRESIFAESKVKDIKQYNQKFSDEKMKQILLVADEYENTVNDLDKKKSNEAQSLMISILNIARSSGCVVILGSQSILKGDIDAAKDKVTVRFSGKNEPNVLNSVDKSIASYFKSFSGKPQGVFFFRADNLQPDGDVVTTGDTSFVLVQTPYISDISAKTLPKLYGAEFESEIFGQTENEENSNSVSAFDDYL